MAIGEPQAGSDHVQAVAPCQWAVQRGQVQSGGGYQAGRFREYPRDGPLLGRCAVG